MADAITVDKIPYSLRDENPQEFADALGRSFRETGFAIITGHPLDQHLISRTQELTKKFFDLPTDTKKQYAFPDIGHQRGYSPFGTENAKGRTIADLKEFWHVGRNGVANLPDNPDVAEVEEFDDVTRAMFKAMDEFGQSLLSAISLHLGEGEDGLSHGTDRGNSILRLLHYPPVDGGIPAGAERASAHEDINLITLLLGAEEGGLEVLHSSGEWLEVNPDPGDIVINSGDMLHRLTAGCLPSTTHRVVNPPQARSDRSRFSMPFFFHPNNDFLIAPLPQCVEETGQKEADITAGDFLQQRLEEIGLVKKAG